MRWLKISLGVVVFLVAVFVLGGLLLPDKVQVERSILIERPPAEVYAVVSGFERFNEWSPWGMDYDPTAVYEFSGPASGVGARMAWVGEKGSGSQQITEAVANERVGVELDFGSDGKAAAQFILIPEGDGTRTVWRFSGDFAGSMRGRWLGLMLERLIGPDYEKGLANLKQLVESESPPVDAPVDSADAATAEPAADGDGT
jgi:uncharacterized protein YndB with AHSA1/START domain